MAESKFTGAFLNTLAINLESKLVNEYKVMRGCHVTIGEPKSQGFIYDIGLTSKNRKKMVLIEAEIGGKTPIYNLMKTIYWYTICKNRPPHVMFLHIFPTESKSKEWNVRQDLVDFTNQIVIKEMFEYKQINFPRLGELRLATTTEYLTSVGKITDELELRLKEARQELFSGKDRLLPKLREELKTATEELREHKRDLQDIRMKVIDRINDEIAPHLSKKIVKNIKEWKVQYSSNNKFS